MLHFSSRKIVTSASFPIWNSVKNLPVEIWNKPPLCVYGLLWLQLHEQDEIHATTKTASALIKSSKLTQAQEMSMHRHVALMPQQS